MSTTGELTIKVSPATVDYYNQSPPEVKDDVARLIEAWLTPQTEVSRKKYGQKLLKTMDKISKEAKAHGMTLDDLEDALGSPEHH